MEALFTSEPDPGYPGWNRWELHDSGRFLDTLGSVHVQPDVDGKARVRMVPGRQHSNMLNNVHGGAMLGFIDIALFAGAETCGAKAAGNAVTLDCNVQFLAGAVLDEPLDAVVEVLRETGRLIFVRGLVEQASGTIAAFSATLRKAGKR
ncbi:PaaI family thioesterase [Sphingomonas sp. KC8]|uniref:PaaI family thioesterase n=1 Tax=Sphingomonas sp. KC8 TaxID=1030157 RepID=UPI0002489787|nr:PaaI family thioesterase [Sphingomonas sp. KC8]ARS26593.1 phenylacetic acid degradation-like protein [Sphingomonas sp. KC8]